MLRGILFLLLVVLLFSLSAKTPQDTLVLALSAEPSVLNPILYTDVTSGTVADFVFSGLVRYNQQLEIVGDLARRWTVSRDGLTYTFYLRNDVYWHDGRKFTARDVVFTFNKILDPKTNTVRRSNFIINRKKIRYYAKDTYTVVFVLPSKFAPFLSRVGIGILPKHLLQKEDINTTGFNHLPIGTGPFKFGEWKTGTSIRLLANEQYFRGKPKLKSILLKILPDSNAQFMALKKGEIDLSSIPPRQLALFKKHKDLTIVKYDGLSYNYIGLNNRVKLFQNKQIRKALDLALPKDKLVKAVSHGLNRSAYFPMSPISKAYNRFYKPKKYNPQLAQKILIQKGWKKGDDGILIKGKQRFSFTLLLPKGARDSLRIALVCQQYWKKIGIEVDIKVLEWNLLLQKINFEKKDFDAVLIGWSLGIDPDGYNLWHSSTYPKGFNFIGYRNREVDRLLVRARSEMNEKKRYVLYRKLYSMIARDYPYIFLWYPKSIVCIRNEVRGLAEPGPAGLILDPEKVYKAAQ
ncbi:peptide-binding protein [Candidatus Margulisiibacteriota bacterium]